jgi:hypothetical protein
LSSGRDGSRRCFGDKEMARQSGELAIVFVANQQPDAVRKQQRGV